MLTRESAIVTGNSEPETGNRGLYLPPVKSTLQNEPPRSRNNGI